MSSFPDQPSGMPDNPAEDRIRIDTPEQISLEFPLAGIGSRFMAIAVDTLLQILLLTAAIFAIIALAKYAPPSTGRVPAATAGKLQTWIPALLVIFMFCLYWGYYAFFEIIWKGQTPGKRIAAIRVIKNSGRALNVYEVIGRNLLRGVDWLPFMYVVGIVSMMISRQNQRLGDHLVGSIVVHDKRVEEIRPEWAATGEQTSANPQLSNITPEELILIETYLQRRHTLELGSRDAAALKIATRITKRTGIERSSEQSLDGFLESIAKTVRDSARFR